MAIKLAIKNGTDKITTGIKKIKKLLISKVRIKRAIIISKNNDVEIAVVVFSPN